MNSTIQALFQTDLSSDPPSGLVRFFPLECVKWLAYSRSLKMSHINMFQNHMNGIRFRHKERSNSTKINYLCNIRKENEH